MKTTLISIICVLVASVIAFVSISAQDARPAAASNCLSVPACAFLETANTDHYYRSHDLNSSGNEYGGNDTHYCAPVYLPEGATIRKIVLMCRDEHSTENILVQLWRRNLSQTSSQMTSVQSSGSTSGWRSFANSTVSPRLVNNFKNSYYLFLSLPDTNLSGLSFDRVRILYDVP